MKMGNYNKKDLEKKNYAVISYDYEDGVYYIESLHEEFEKSKKRCDYLVKEEYRLMARPEGWYAIDYMVVKKDNERLYKCFNLEMESE